ncbi:hypothetical protein [Olsenella uli]|uniref:hypothetical protein n=1 Tax=Olsenella uli TaxID=133926 RepID=UPI003D7A91C9
MAFDGVFAFQGKDHITASQLGRIVEGVAGKGRYVLPTLNQMTAEMQTANKVRVGTGDLVMDGRVVTNEAAVDLTVESGTSGYKRNDLVVCRYTKNASTGVEKFAAEVVKGTPTTGTAADPKVTEGDISRGSASAVMPLWRIPLNGITPGAPVRIAPVASTLKTLGDSVSQVPRIRKFSTSIARSGSNWDSDGRLLAISKGEYKELVGRDFNGFDVVQAFNGDNTVNAFDVTNLSYWGSGNFWVDVYGGRSGYTAQINIKIIVIDFE